MDLVLDFFLCTEILIFSQTRKPFNKLNYLSIGNLIFLLSCLLTEYIPQLTNQISISVALPEQFRGRTWILGWHQEIFPIPSCRLCTNTEQSYTIPVTLFLQDDGWCPEVIFQFLLFNCLTG